jgi:hypothetical protein
VSWVQSIIRDEKKNVADWSAEIAKYVAGKTTLTDIEKEVVRAMLAEREKKLKKEYPNGGASSNEELLKKLGISLNTGGYTGAWGPEGRWAMLHQKEIVLNAHDTENFLSAIEILRGITQAIDLQAMSFGNMFTSTLPYLQNTSSTLQQDVTIHAEFPNATDHNEIQLAIEGLVNSAS